AAGRRRSDGRLLCRASQLLFPRHTLPRHHAGLRRRRGLSAGVVRLCDTGAAVRTLRLPLGAPEHEKGASHMIELKKVNKSYGAQKVLDDITVTLERGRVHGFVGRNGSGKTILMKCIAGLARPDSGEVLVDGRHIGTELENPPDMGAIIEVPGFLPNASG